MVDISDLKSLARTSVGVRVPSPAPTNTLLTYVMECVFLSLVPKVKRKRATT